MLSIVWIPDTQETIVNCFVEVGFSVHAVASGQDCDYDGDDNDDDGQNCAVWSKLQVKPNINATFEEFIPTDDAFLHEKRCTGTNFVVSWMQTQMKEMAPAVTANQYLHVIRPRGTHRTMVIFNKTPVMSYKIACGTYKYTLAVFL
jgi:hypothetical protein